LHHPRTTTPVRALLFARSARANDQPSLKLAVWLAFRRTEDPRDASLSIPIAREVRQRSVGTSVRGHDVLGIGWQTVGRAMQPITTMMPVRQCGHSYTEHPVSASKRSR
jgi:hypothetical protein